MVGQFPFTTFQSPKGTFPRDIFVKDAVHEQYSRAIEEVKQSTLLKQMKSLAARLEKDGVQLFFLVIPSHLALHRDLLPSGPLPPEDEWSELGDPGPEDAYGVYRAVVDSDPKRILDLFKIYRDYRHAHPNELLYVPPDTHWTSLGIAVAVQGMLGLLGQRGMQVSLGTIAFDGFAEPTCDFIVLQTMHLPARYCLSNPELYFTEPRYFLRHDAKKDPISSNGGRLIVVGTSFTERFQHTGYGFGRMLGAALGKKTITSGKIAGGARQGLVDLIGSGFTFERGDTVIWEMPLTNLLSEAKSEVPDVPVKH
jgi:hypothetical protein